MSGQCGQRVGKRDLRQARTALEGIDADRRHGVRQRHALQRRQLPERVGRQRCHSLRHRDAGQLAAPLERAGVCATSRAVVSRAVFETIRYALPANGQIHTVQVRTVVERPGRNRRHAVRQLNARQARAFVERTTLERGQTVRQIYVLQGGTALEAVCADRCQRIVKAHCGQGGTAVERLGPDGGHGIREPHALQARISIERVRADRLHGVIVDLSGDHHLFGTSVILRNADKAAVQHAVLEVRAGGLGTKRIRNRRFYICHGICARIYGIALSIWLKCIARFMVAHPICIS